MKGREMMLDKLDRIQLTLNHIEANLKAEIQISELGKMAGYSSSYYSDLFRKATGLTLKQYLLHRRLTHALYEVSKGMGLQDAALEYGFDTYAGFYRAFCRKYGCGPSDYLKDHKPARPYKMILKQEERIMVSKKTIQKILVHWGKENDTINEVYYEGSGQISENDFYVGEEWILKISAMPGGLEKHMSISESLKKSGLSVSLPIPSLEGKMIVQEGELFCILCQRVKGIRLNSKQLFSENGKELAYQFGRTIGQIHLALEKMDTQLYQEYHLYDVVRTWAIPEIQKKSILTASFIKEYSQTFGEIYEELPQQMIHRNMNLSYVYTKNGVLSGITDFELSEYSIRLFDPCYAATGILSENFENREDHIRNWIVLYKEILKGYDTVIHLTENEKKAAPYVVFSIQLICTAYFSSMDKFADLARVNEKILLHLAKHTEELSII